MGGAIPGEVVVTTRWLGAVGPAELWRWAALKLVLASVRRMREAS